MGVYWLSNDVAEEVIVFAVFVGLMVRATYGYLVVTISYRCCHFFLHSRCCFQLIHPESLRTAAYGANLLKAILRIINFRSTMEQKYMPNFAFLNSSSIKNTCFQLSLSVFCSNHILISIKYVSQSSPLI